MRKKVQLFFNNGFAAIFLASTLALGVVGCGLVLWEAAKAEESDAGGNATDDADARELAEICLELYQKAAEEHKLADLETVRGIVNRLGEYGYSAVDSENQVNMTMPENVIRFCSAVKQKKAAETVIFRVDYFGGFVKYDLQTKEGKVEGTRSYFSYENGVIQKKSEESYQVTNWTYTEEGYVMFCGTYFSGEQYAVTLSNAEEYVALRVEPLDEQYRELNRAYLRPIGYERNNLFITNWDENDFGDLDFYDLFDIFYPKIYGNEFPLIPEKSSGEADVYRIPREDFERVIQTYFCIDSETLRSKTVYQQENAAYEYRPRGFEEAEYPEYPYSEVVGFTENSDKTLTLTTRVVFPYGGNSSVYVHEVTVRPLENGGVQYVSNRIVPSENNGEITWHTPRLTADEWEEAEDSPYWLVPQSAHCLLTKAEEQQLQEQAMQAAGSVRDIYQATDISDAPSYTSGVTGFTREQRRAVVKRLGNTGLVSVAENTNMQNGQEVKRFYEEYQKGQNTMVTVYEVEPDGLIGSMTFLCRDRQIQMYYVGIRWKEGSIPELQGTSVSDVSEIKLTEKGYFIYAYDDVMAHASMRQYWRIQPLSEKCRELTEKYIAGLSYVNYNMLVTNWDAGNVEDILMPCMYEDIYRIATGEILQTENWKIPAEEYERIMTTYFPVSVEQLRENCGYDAAAGSYEHEMISASPYPPFGEVVDYQEHGDGTMTLIVDGVWPDYNSDLAFRNEVVVRPFADGTFRYLSNSIEKRELDIPVVRKEF